MKKQTETILRQVLTNTKVKTKQDEIKEEIKITQQKLQQLKNVSNPKLLQRIRMIEKEIKRLQIININDVTNQETLEKLINNDQQEEKYENMLTEASNNENLRMLKNITTKNYSKQNDLIEQKSNQINSIERQQFSPTDYITSLEQKTKPLIMESQIYPLINRYLTTKLSLLTKIIQLNPQKRHNNSLLIPHQRVMLKQHLDITRRIIEELNKKTELLSQELDKDFIIVKNKWEQSERQLTRLSQNSPSS